MPAIRPELKLPKKFADKLPPAEALPVLDDAFKAEQRQKFVGKCEAGKCRLTQAVMQPGNLQQLVTSCSECGERAQVDCAL